MEIRYGLVCCLLLGGCQTQKADLGDRIQVIIEGGGSFPVALAGRWQADRHGWQFVFEPDGRISSAVLSLGRVEIAPGVNTTVPTRGGGQGTFRPGLWTVHYEPTAGELTVKIVMDYVRVEMAGNVLEGRSIDTLSGPISPADGVWQAQWAAFTQYKIRTAEGDASELSTDPAYGETQPLTFHRQPQP